jgi:hypothetical protein
VHFLGDTFGTEETPILGQSFIKPFREHHVNPKGMTEHDFVETSGNNCIVSIPFLLLVYYLVDIKSSLFHYSFYSFFSFLMIAVFITNQIHKWAHMENPGRLISFLQKQNLILSPEHHQVHHTEPFDKYYCITNDCKGIVRSDKYYCTTYDCKGVAANDKYYCRSKLCKAWVTKDKYYCDSSDADCRGIASNDSYYCKSRQCKAIVKRDKYYCN